MKMFIKKQIVGLGLAVAGAVRCRYRLIDK